MRGSRSYNSAFIPDSQAGVAGLSLLVLTLAKPATTTLLCRAEGVTS